MPDYDIGRIMRTSGDAEILSDVTALHVVTANQRRGAEVFAVDLTRALARRGVRGDTIALVPRQDGDPLDVATLGRRPFGATTLRSLRRQGQSADVVVAHGSKTLPACAAALAGTDTPFVYRSIGDPAAWSGHGLRRRRTTWLLRRATAVVALWPGAAEVLTLLHRVPPEKVGVIPNGVPASRCPVPDRDQRTAARRSLGLPADVPIAAYVGALSPEKDVSTAVAALASLDDVHLLVVGEGPDRPQLAHFADSVAPGRVHFAGRLPGPQTALAAADLVVLPSRTEGMPGVLIEAGLSARPAVASDVGGVGQIVKHGTTGMLAQPGDATSLADGIRAVLEVAPAMGEAARQHCLARFEIDIVAARWAELLRGITSGKRRS